MPIYEYQCPACGAIFSHLWRTIAAAEEGETPPCPQCQNEGTRRIVSQVAVLGELGGLTPGEEAAARKRAERQASITPREQIDRLQAGKKKGHGG